MYKKKRGDVRNMLLPDDDGCWAGIVIHGRTSPAVRLLLFGGGAVRRLRRRIATATVSVSKCLRTIRFLINSHLDFFIWISISDFFFLLLLCILFDFCFCFLGGGRGRRGGGAGGGGREMFCVLLLIYFHWLVYFVPSWQLCRRQISIFPSQFLMMPIAEAASVRFSVRNSQ